MRSTAIFATAFVLTSPVSGHHSDAALDMESVVNFEGTVTAFNWRNPHVYFTVETTDERGEQVEWTLQMASTITVSRMGWDARGIIDRGPGHGRGACRAQRATVWVC